MAYLTLTEVQACQRFCYMAKEQLLCAYSFVGDKSFTWVFYSFVTYICRQKFKS